MFRYSLLAIFVITLCIYAWKDWFIALCALVLFTSVTQHPSMPEGVCGIPGLKAWNVCFFVIVAAWCADKKRDLSFAPTRITVCVISYGLLLLIGALRAWLDVDVLAQRAPHLSSMKALIFELIVNPAKYLLLGVLFYQGCQNRRNLWAGVCTLLLLGVTYALLMYKTLSLRIFQGNYEDARRLTDKLIGLHAVDLAALLTVGFWFAIVFALVLGGYRRWFGIGVAALSLPCIVGCHGRAAYVAFVFTGLALGVVRWRGLLLTFPVGVLGACAAFPQIVERAEMGFEQSAQRAETDWNKVTAGRTHNIWAPTFQEFMRAPVLGHGRMAIYRTSAYAAILHREGNITGHPHNSYLEIGVEHGLVGLGVVLTLVGVMAYRSTIILRQRGDPLLILVGGFGFIAVTNILVQGLSSRFFYPKQSLMWFICSYALVQGVYAMRWNAAKNLRRSA